MMGLGSAQFHAVPNFLTAGPLITLVIRFILEPKLLAMPTNGWSSQFIEDGSYTSLRSASLTYNLKDALSMIG